MVRRVATHAPFLGPLWPAARARSASEVSSVAAGFGCGAQANAGRAAVDVGVPERRRQAAGGERLAGPLRQPRVARQRHDGATDESRRLCVRQVEAPLARELDVELTAVADCGGI